MSENKRIWIKSSIIVIAALLIPAWNFIRVNSYMDRDRTVTFPNGQKVSVHLAEVNRVDTDKVQVSMEFTWKSDSRNASFYPDTAIAITRPHGTSGPFRATPRNSSHNSQENMYGLMQEYQYDRCDNLFVLKTDDNSIDITQSVYYRKPANRVSVELPLTISPGKRTVKKERTAKVELIDFGESTKYRSEAWEVLIADRRDRLPLDTFCVRVKQEAADGPLINWPEVNGSGIAELVDSHGQTVPMTAQCVAKRDCEHMTIEKDVTTFREKLRGIHSNRWGTQIIPKNGEWLYAFKLKPNRKYVKIRIHYVLPPKPQDKVTVRFDKVPI